MLSQVIIVGQASTAGTKALSAQLPSPCRDAHLDFGETAQNDPMVKRLQTSFIRKLERCQQIEAWSGFTVHGLGTAWIVFFFSCLCSKISVNFSSSTTLY